MTASEIFADVYGFVNPAHRAGYLKSIINITESGETTTCTRVTFKTRTGSRARTPNDIRSFVIKVDVLSQNINCSNAHPILNPNVAGNVRCPDGIIVFYKPTIDRLFVLPLEMKSTNVGGRLKQAYSGKIVFEYILGMIEAKYSKKIPRENILYTMVLFRSENSGSAENATPFMPKLIKNNPTLNIINHPSLDISYIDLFCNQSYNLNMFVYS